MKILTSKTLPALTLVVSALIFYSCTKDEPEPEPKPEPEPDLYQDLPRADTVIGYHIVLIQTFPPNEEIRESYGSIKENVFISFDIGGDVGELDDTDHYFVTDSTANYTFTYQGKGEPFEEITKRYSYDNWDLAEKDSGGFVTLVQMKSAAAWDNVYDFTNHDDGKVIRYIPYKKDSADKYLQFLGWRSPLDLYETPPESARIYGNMALFFLEYGQRRLTWWP